jgi:hypothetical protein
MRGFLVLRICANIADVRVGEANHLPGIAGIGENFLITREAGIENDFPAAANFRPSRAPAK